MPKDWKIQNGEGVIFPKTDLQNANQNQLADLKIPVEIEAKNIQKEKQNGRIHII
jgi:hypothetical protein